MITLVAGSGSSVIAPASTGSATTTTAGQATFTVTDAAAETVAYAATDMTDSIALTGQSVSVTFGTLTVSATDSTVTTTTPIVATVASSGPAADGNGHRHPARWHQSRRGQDRYVEFLVHDGGHHTRLASDGSQRPGVIQR